MLGKLVRSPHPSVVTSRQPAHKVCAFLSPSLPVSSYLHVQQVRSGILFLVTAILRVFLLAHNFWWFVDTKEGEIVNEFSLFKACHRGDCHQTAHLVMPDKDKRHLAIAGTAVGLALCGIALVFLSLRQRTAIIASGSLALIFGVASVAAVGAILSESDVSPLARELTYGTYLAILACITNFAAVLVGSFVGHSVYDLMSV
eukprot:m.103674 g.103674  ORF g.103674 m.103674 type:complete len:201 (+) comp51574_c0_seq21:2474-3076(+)